MKTLGTVTIVILSLGILAAATLFAIGYFRPKPGGLIVKTTPESMVYINDVFVGKTPLDTTYKAGEVSVKLVPVDTGNALLPYEVKTILTPKVKTVIQYEFSDSIQKAFGEVVSFEKDAGDNSGIVVISEPDNSQVLIDGVSKGFSPVKVSTIAPGEHQLIVKSVGYKERALTIRSVSGYKLTVSIKLAASEEEKVEEPETVTKEYVEILETPTGFLRVRTEPGSRGSEIDQVKPGAKYPLISKDAETGWYQIQLEEPVAGLPNGRVGWVSNEYAKVATESAAVIMPQ